VYNGSVTPVFDQRTLDFISHSEAQTRRLGARLGLLLSGGEVIGLDGELGTGKTRWVQGIGAGLGVAGPITSPTFVLIGEHVGRLPLYHIDLYRISDLAEALALGLEDYLYGGGVCCIEWAERAKAVLPAERMWVSLRHVDETRRGVTMQGEGRRYEALLAAFKKSAFGA
jgi:tRNA threonylcarbamoyladenosine biosynthesis protein TsaE